MVIMCDANDFLDYGWRKSELSNVPLHMKQDSNIMEKYTLTS